MHDGTGLSPAACASPCAIKLHNITYTHHRRGIAIEREPCGILARAVSEVTLQAHRLAKLYAVQICSFQ